MRYSPEIVIPRLGETWGTTTGDAPIDTTAFVFQRAPVILDGLGSVPEH